MPFFSKQNKKFIAQIAVENKRTKRQRTKDYSYPLNLNKTFKNKDSKKL